MDDVVRLTSAAVMGIGKDQIAVSVHAHTGMHGWTQQQHMKMHTTTQSAATVVRVTASQVNASALKGLRVKHVNDHSAPMTAVVMGHVSTLKILPLIQRLVVHPGVHMRTAGTAQRLGDASVIQGGIQMTAAAGCAHVGMTH
jgi:hypothetical protein